MSTYSVRVTYTVRVHRTCRLDERATLLIGYLAYRAGYLPRVLGVLLAISGLGYAIDSLGAVLSQGTWTDISTFTFIGEFLLALWLVIRARRIAASATALEAAPIAHRTMDDVNA